MTLEQFRAKWGLVFGSLVICELISRVDSNTPLTAAGNDLADDLRKLLAVEKVNTVTPMDASVGFPRRFVERPDGDSKGSER